MFNSKIFKISLITIAIYLLLNFFFFSKTYRLSNSSEVIAFSPNSEMIAVASGEPKTYYKASNHSIHGASSTVEIRKVFNGKIIQTLDFPAATSVAFSPDNKFLATGNYGKDVKVWRISDGKLIYSLEKADPPFAGRTRLLAFTPDGNTLVASSGDYATIDEDFNDISVWDLESDSIRYSLSELFTCAAVNTNEQLLAFGGRTEPLAIHRLDNGTSLRAIDNIDKRSFHCRHLQFSEDSKLLVFLSLSRYRRIQVYNTEENKLISEISARDPFSRHYLSQIALSSNGQYVAASYIIDNYGTGIIFPYIPKAFLSRIRIWNVETGRPIKTIAAHRKGINTIAFSPNGKWLASAGRDSRVKLWRMPPINYRIWLLSAGGLATLVYWCRNQSRD